MDDITLQVISMLQLARGHYGILAGMRPVSRTRLLSPCLAVFVDASRHVIRNLEVSVSFQSVDASW